MACVVVVVSVCVFVCVEGGVGGVHISLAALRAAPKTLPPELIATHMSQPAESTRPYQHVLGMLKVGVHLCSGRAPDVRVGCHQQEPRPDGADRKEQELPVLRVPARPQRCWYKDRQPQQHRQA